MQNFPNLYLQINFKRMGRIKSLQPRCCSSWGNYIMYYSLAKMNSTINLFPITWSFIYFISMFFLKLGYW